MTRALYSAPVQHEVAAAQIASLRARVAQLEAELAQLRAERQLDVEFRQVAAAEAVEFAGALS